MREDDPHFWEGTAPLSAVALAPSEMGAAATWGGRMPEVAPRSPPGRIRPRSANVRPRDRPKADSHPLVAPEVAASDSPGTTIGSLRRPACRIHVPPRGSGIRRKRAYSPARMACVDGYGRTGRTPPLSEGRAWSSGGNTTAAPLRRGAAGMHLRGATASLAFGQPALSHHARLAPLPDRGGHLAIDRVLHFTRRENPRNTRRHSCVRPQITQ